MAKSSGKATIKKYANRRLYDTESSTYITLDRLGEMIREGREFEVVDAKTGEDITRHVLTQIIVDEEARGSTMLPVNFLRQLIGLYGNSMQGMVPQYLEAAMEAFQRNQSVMRDAFGDRDTFGLEPRDLGRIVGQQSDAVDPQRAEHRRGHAIVALVVGEAEPAVGVDRIEPAVLQLVGAKLVGEADAAAFLA